MGYKVSTSQQFVQFAITGHLSHTELGRLNQEVTAWLDEQPGKATVIMDASQLIPGYQTANQLQETQKFMNHPHLGKIVVISESKLTRLVMLIAFSLCPAQLIQLDDFEQAVRYIERHETGPLKQVR